MRRTIFIAVVYVAIIVAGLHWMDSEINSRLTFDKGTAEASEFCHGGLEPVPSFCTDSSLTVVTDTNIQPFGRGQEDDDTAQLHVQPTRNPQVTTNSVFIQGSL